MKHLDFTIDFETCSLSANAAVMQMAIVPWLRDGEDTPFLDWQEHEPYAGYVALRTCVMEGFDFDPYTIKWWAERTDVVKNAVTAGMPEPVSDVLCYGLHYIHQMVEKFKYDSICVWAQGPDVDIAILRNLCRKYDIKLEDYLPYASFRDCRTVILETALVMLSHAKKDSSSAQPKDYISDADILRDAELAYRMYKPLPDMFGKLTKASQPHDAVYDAARSSWNTWQALKFLKTL